MLTLGIETSCDEASAAVVEDGRRVRSNVVSSQADLHARWGGVVPEVASRRHVETLLPVVVEALAAAGTTGGAIDGIAVTNRPGLIGALVVGVSAAKALALAWDVPLVGVHHLAGHLHANLLDHDDARLPLMSLVVSGGHTELILMRADGGCVCLGRTRDDAAGECFDKCARLLGLPYPGGPHIERLAEAGDPTSVPLPRAWMPDSLEFSFSGLKTAVARYVRGVVGSVPVEDVAASLQAAIIDVLVAKAIRAAESVGVAQVAVSGGVAANRMLASRLTSECAARGLQALVPHSSLCTDNAAMIAAAGAARLKCGESDGLKLDAVATDHFPMASSAG